MFCQTFHELHKIAAVNALDEGTAIKRRAAIGSALAAANKARLAKSCDS